MTTQTTSQKIKVRACSIVCTDHPEWGTWGVMEDRDGHFVIQGDSGSRVLNKSEADRFWSLKADFDANAFALNQAARALVGTTTAVWEVTESHPIAACFASVGTRHYYIVRVKNSGYKGSPWAVGYVSGTEDTATNLKIDTCWFHSKRDAYREFLAEGRDRAYSLVENRQFKTLSY